MLVDKAGIGGTLASTSGFVNNAVVGQAIDDNRESWLRRFTFSRQSVSPAKGLLGQKDNTTGKKKLRKFSLRRKSKVLEEGMMRQPGSFSL